MLLLSVVALCLLCVVGWRCLVWVSHMFVCVCLCLSGLVFRMLVCFVVCDCVVCLFVGWFWFVQNKKKKHLFLLSDYVCWVSFVLFLFVCGVCVSCVCDWVCCVCVVLCLSSAFVCCDCVLCIFVLCCCYCFHWLLMCCVYWLQCYIVLLCACFLLDCVCVCLLSFGVVII